MKHGTVVVGLLVLVPLFALGAPSRGGMRGFFSGGSVGYNVLFPSQDISLNRGTFVSLDAEKPFGFLNLYLTAGLAYLRTTGSMSYNYTAGSTVYARTNTSFDSDETLVTLGLRVKFLENQVIVPFIEGGGQGGYLQLTFEDRLREDFSETGTEFRNPEGALTFGAYGQAGVLVHMTSNLSLHLAYRYTDSVSRPFETLGKQSLRQSTSIFFGGIGFGF